MVRTLTTTLCALAFVVVSSQTGHSATNEYCPIMPDSPASAEWSTVYRGQRINFCCNNCLNNFRSDPHAYVDKIVQLERSEPATQTSSIERITTSIESAKAWSQSPQGHVAIVFAAAGLAFGGWRWLQRRRHKRSQTPITLRPLLAELLVFGLLAFSAHTAWTNADLKTEVTKQTVLRLVHHSTYYDHGYPPKPPRPDSPKGLSGRYYRGNDERSEFLYNGGNYQTATFDICLQRQDGSRIRHGDNIAGEQLFLAYAITRPKQSPDRLFSQEIMGRMYLTQEYGEMMGYDGPIRDRIALEKLDPYRWQARYPLGVVAESGSQKLDPSNVTADDLLHIPSVSAQQADWFIAYRDAGFPIRGRADLRQAGIDGAAQESLAAAFGNVTREGNVYVCEAFFSGKRQLGARFHYGIGFKLFVQDGHVMPGSDIWLGALSRSQKAAKGEIPDDQWLSENPLPVAPKKQELSDELLGIDDWETQ